MKWFRIRRALAYMLTLCLLLALLPATAQAAETYWSDDGVRDASFAGGDGGSEQTAYQISTPAQLGYMAHLINTEWETYKNKYYELTGNIDLDGHQWQPIGNSSGAFSGAFDGGNFEITNMKITVDGASGADRFAGLFGKIYGGTVKNVTIGAGSAVTAHYTGNTSPIGYAAVAGDISGSGTAENCRSAAAVAVTFTNNSLSAYVGGVVGYLENGTVKNCANAGAIGGTSVTAGGVAGGNGNTGAGTIQNCWNTGDLTADGSGSYAGGIVGYNSHQNSVVKNCYSTGNIEGKKDSSYYGGVAGANNGTIENCYSAGILALPDSKRMSAGGLVGDNYDWGNGKAINSYWRKDNGVNETLSDVGTSGTETDVFSFGNDGALTSPVTIGGQSYTGLLSALSAWVDTQSGDYWFWSGAAAAPALTKDPPPKTYAVTVNVNKDDAPWTDHGKTFRLVSGGTTVTNLNAVENGTYEVYELAADTGVNVTVHGAGAGATVDYYTVTFYDGSTAYGSGTPQAVQTVLKNGKAAAPVSNPAKTNYIFDKWVAAGSGETAFDFANTPITAATGVYAKWIYDTSTEVAVALHAGEPPYYKGDSITLTAEVINKATHAAVTAGTVQFYKGGDTLGGPVAYDSRTEPPKGFSLSVVCGASDYFPYLSLGENTVKAVYTPETGAAVTSEAVTLTVLSMQNGNRFLGSVTAGTTYNGSAAGTCPVQFTIVNAGEAAGITAEQLTITGRKENQAFDDFTVQYNTDKTIAYVYVQKPGTYTFQAVLDKNAAYTAEKTATATVRQARLTVTPDDAVISVGSAPEFSYTADGLQGGDQITDVTYSTTAGGNYSAAGIYEISIDTMAMSNADCYTVEKKTATLTVQADSFIPVSGIRDVPATATVGRLTLSGTVEPLTATNKSIAWTVKDQGGTGAAIDGSALTTTAAGTVTVTATVVNGKADGTNYTQDFAIAITPAQQSAVRTVTFDVNGGDPLTPPTAQTDENGKLQRLPTPTRSGGYRFDGWYLRDGTPVTADTRFTEDATVIAQWTRTGGGSSGSGSGTTTKTEKNPDGSTTTTVTNRVTGTVTETTKAKDGTVTVVETRKDGGKTYTEQRLDGTKISAELPLNGETTAKVTLPKNTETVISFPTAAGTVVLQSLPDNTEAPVAFSLVENGKVYVRLDGDAELRVETRADLFDDMAGHWAKEPADFTGARELFTGTAPRVFSPNENMTRAMLTTVLYRLDGEPAAGASSFGDVESGKWYADSVAWAAETGIAGGIGGGLFGTERGITRQELAVMLYHYAVHSGMDVSAGENTDLLSFTDIGTASEWAIPALQWACGEGVLQGDKTGALHPTAPVTRAEAAAMLQRFITAAVK